LDIPTDSKTTKQLVPQTLTLSHGRKTTVLDFLGVEFDRVLGILETLLHKGSELSNTAPLLA